MSKKEQKLKKNLYKALTKYFIHNAKNSLASSESILDQLASFRMETGLPAALRQDKKYQKAQKNCNKANEKMQDLNLTPQQWDAVDAAITAENIASICDILFVKTNHFFKISNITTSADLPHTGYSWLNCQSCTMVQLIKIRFRNQRWPGSNY